MSALPSSTPYSGGFSAELRALEPSLDPVILARLGVLQGTEALLPKSAVLGLGWPELEKALPDGGFPRGVVENAARRTTTTRASYNHRDAYVSMRGGATSIAIAAVSAVHAADEHAWCAWVTPENDLSGDRAEARAPFLYAPALAHANVDLDRLLVVRPKSAELARTIVKIAASGAFGLVIVDVPHPNDLCSRSSIKGGGKNDGSVVVRKLALAAEESGTTSVLLTSALAPRAIPWPVALRIEVERRPEALSLHVTKSRTRAGSSQHLVRLLTG